MFDSGMTQKKSQRYFAYGIIASTILHVVCSLFLLAPPKTSSVRSVTYLDLNQFQEPAAAPQLKAAAPQPPPPLSPAEPQQEAEPAPEPAAAETEPAPSTPSGAEQTPAASQADALESVKSVMGLGLSRGYFKSLGEGSTLRGDIRPYYIEMLQEVNQKWWMDEGLLKQKVSPLVLNLVIARNGQIVDQSIMISSGNRAYDRAVLEAIRKASPLPPLPASYEYDFFQAPIRLVPPLKLFGS